MELMEAIWKRKSVRKYSEKKLSDKTLEEIKGIIAGAGRLYPEINLEIKLVEDGRRLHKIIKGVVGSFGKIVSPHYLVVTTEDREGSFVDAGYAVEDVILRLTAKGIATCWIGGHVSEDSLRESLGFEVSRKPVVLVALGYPQEGRDVFRENPAEAKRKPVNDITSGSFDETWLKILEAARIAPSAANSQPWYFKARDGQIDVFCNEPGNFLMRQFLGEINLVDIGIALFHISAAAGYYGRKISFEADSSLKAKKDGYITSVIY